MYDPQHEDAVRIPSHLAIDTAICGMAELGEPPMCITDRAK
jgi:2-methylcitrate dehydratase PrpD